MSHNKPTKREIKLKETELKEDRDEMEEENRVIRLIDDPDPEQVMEEEEASYGEGRDVIKDIPGMSGHTKVMANRNDLPEGMEDVVRGQDEDIEKKGEDLETGEE